LTTNRQTKTGPRWPRASLRTYLVGIILVATVPLAVLVAFQAIREARGPVPGQIDDGRAALVALGTAGLCLLLGATAALLVARRVTEPVGRLASGASASEIGPVVVDEIEGLRKAIEDASRERHVATERLARKAQEAEAASRAKDEFLAMLGHELRNPMNAIATSVAVLDRLDADSPVAVSARQVIARQVRKLAQMTDELLDVGYLLADDVEMLRQPLNLALVVQRCVESAQAAATARQQTLHAALAPCWIFGDAKRIAQVVDRLLDNALKYSPADASTRIELTVAEGHALLRVSDTGPGIAPELLPRVFEPFAQGARSLDRPEGGLGIGLTVVRRIVELHGGSASARSEASGAVFELRLPTVEAPTPTGQKETAAAASRSRVAVIDDNTDALYGLRSMLELDGHAVKTAADGETGLSLLLYDAPDIAIVDIGLPGLDGYEVARRSRAKGYRGRLIALSGYGQTNDLQRSLAAGFEAHLVKPVEPTHLQRLIANG
jgi:signal transduction histidine kinase/CheY-like chemotaxis protein